MFLLFNRWIWTQITPRGMYIIIAKHCISPTRSVVYHPQLVAVYHQCGALYIVKPQVDARWRVMRYSPKGADDIHDCVVMIRQACGLGKQKQNLCPIDKSSAFVGLPERIRTFDLQSRSLTRYPAVPRADIKFWKVNPFGFEPSIHRRRRAVPATTKDYFWALAW